MIVNSNTSIVNEHSRLSQMNVNLHIKLNSIDYLVCIVDRHVIMNYRLLERR